MRENRTYGLMRRGWQSQPFTLQIAVGAWGGANKPEKSAYFAAEARVGTNKPEKLAYSAAEARVGANKPGKSA